MAPVYDLVRSRYATALVAACFAAALLVMAIMVASTSAGIGGRLRPAATPAESRSVVNEQPGPEFTALREASVAAGLAGPAELASLGPTLTPAPAPTGPAPSPDSPDEPVIPTSPPTLVPEAPATPLDETVDEVTAELTAILDTLSTTVGGDLLP